jgi:hypothetical protein
VKHIKRKKHSGYAAGFLRSQGVGLIIFAAIAVIIITAVGNASEKSSSEQLRITEESIKRAVVSCYAIEGRYPESLEYLTDNYGLTIDTEKYIVHYEIFASNIMPQITVMPV